MRNFTIHFWSFINNRFGLGSDRILLFAVDLSFYSTGLYNEIKVIVCSLMISIEFTFYLCRKSKRKNAFIV